MQLDSDVVWWGEATNEPDLARQSVATTAREDRPLSDPGFAEASLGQASARPTEVFKLYHDPRFGSGLIGWGEATDEPKLPAVLSKESGLERLLPHRFPSNGPTTRLWT